VASLKKSEKALIIGVKQGKLLIVGEKIRDIKLQSGLSGEVVKNI